MTWICNHNIKSYFMPSLQSSFYTKMRSLPNPFLWISPMMFVTIEWQLCIDSVRILCICRLINVRCKRLMKQKCQRKKLHYHIGENLSFCHIATEKIKDVDVITKNHNLTLWILFWFMLSINGFLSNASDAIRSVKSHFTCYV